MRSCPRHSRTLAKCLAPSRGHSKTTPQRSAGRAVRSTELVPFSTSDEWYSRHRPVWFRLRRVRKRLAVTPVQPLAYARGSLCAIALFLRQLAGILRAIFKLGLRVQEHQIHGAHRAVALFGNDQLGESLQILAVAVVHLFTEDEADQIGVLLDRAGFAEVAQLGPVIALARLDGAAQLREHHHRHAQLLRQQFEAAREGDRKSTRLNA